MVPWNCTVARLFVRERAYTLAPCWSLIREAASIFGVEVLSQQDKMTYKFNAETFREWQQLANTQNLIAREVSKFEGFLLTEATSVEIQKTYVNSYLFSEYLNELEPFLREAEDGHLDLTESEISNIWKCLLALTTSKKELYKSSISLELH